MAKKEKDVSSLVRSQVARHLDKIMTGRHFKELEAGEALVWVIEGFFAVLGPLEEGPPSDAVRVSKVVLFQRRFRSGSVGWVGFRGSGPRRPPSAIDREKRHRHNKQWSALRPSATHPVVRHHCGSPLCNTLVRYAVLTRQAGLQAWLAVSPRRL